MSKEKPTNSEKDARDGADAPSTVADAKARRKGTLAEFLLASPLRGSDIVIERSRDEPRDIFFDDPTDTDGPNG